MGGMFDVDSPVMNVLNKIMNLMILNLCRHYDYPVILSSDSHGTEHVGDLSCALELARTAEVPDKLIRNHSLRELKCFLA